MTSKGFKLTENQKIAVQNLYYARNLIGTNLSTVKALISKGVIEKTNGDASVNYYELQFTEAGQAWANVQFGGETVTVKTPLTWVQVQQLLTENPFRLDIFILYAKTERVVNSVERHIDGYWNVIAGLWRMAFDADNIAYTYAETAPVETSEVAAENVAGEAVADTGYTIPRCSKCRERLLSSGVCGYCDVADAELPFADFDSETVASDTSTVVTMPLEAPITAQIQAVGDAQVLSSVKAEKAPVVPVISKKERRRQKQAAIRAQYAAAQAAVHRQRVMTGIDFLTRTLERNRAA